MKFLGLIVVANNRFQSLSVWRPKLCVFMFTLTLSLVSLITFHYMAISDEKQRVMPMPQDLLPDRSEELIVPESVLLVDPINPDLKGEVHA